MFLPFGTVGKALTCVSVVCLVFPTLSHTKGRITVFLLCPEFPTLSVTPTVCGGDCEREGRKYKELLSTRGKGTVSETA